MNETIKNKLTILPDEPGCYLMRDRQNTIIYVGKAKNLKNRKNDINEAFSARMISNYHSGGMNNNYL